MTIIIISMTRCGYWTTKCLCSAIINSINELWTEDTGCVGIVEKPVHADKVCIDDVLKDNYG